MKRALFVLLLFLFACTPSQPEQKNELPGRWSEPAEMSVSRSEIAATVHDKYIYVIGGLVGSEATDVVERYDGLTNTWETLPPLPQPVHHAAAAANEDNVYVIGGYTDPWEPSASVFAFDPSTGTWEEKSPMLTARGGLIAEVINGRIHAIGGAAESIALGAHEVYDPLADSWETLAPMPTARDHLGSDVLDNTIYVIGGRNVSFAENFDVLEAYDTVTDTWTTRASMPTARGGIGAAMFKGKFYVFGGENTFGVFEDVEAYDPVTDSWEIMKPMLTPRHGHKAVAYMSDIHVLAGATKPGALTAVSSTGKNEAFLPS